MYERQADGQNTLQHNGVKMFLKLNLLNLNLYRMGTVETIEEDSLDSILSPSTSVKIQIIGWKVYLRQ
jgi:hypothetical protein